VNEGNKPPNTMVTFLQECRDSAGYAFVSPNFCMTQSQSSVIKFNSFIFLPPEVSDNKTREGGHVP